MMAFALLATLWLSGCDDEDDNNATTPEPTQSVVGFAQEDDQLSVLADALGQAGLTDVLADESAEFTVFAPSNSAFAAYLQANPDADELSDIPADALADVLKYHVVSGTTLAADLSNGSLNTLLEGQTIEVNTDNGVVLNGSVNVVTADQRVSNGVVHTIDAVLNTNARTATDQTIAEIAVGTEDLSILVDALSRVQPLLDAAGDSTADLTVFAPTNEAFANFLAGDDRFDDLASIPDEVLTKVLQYHILASAKKAADLGDTEETLAGESINIMKSDDGVFINGSTEVTTANIEASNGVVHLIDEVLLPPSLRQEPTIAGLAVATEDLSILVSALQRAPDLLAAADNAESMLTVFAPTNEAFADFLENDPRFNSLEDIPDEVLTQVLQYHILASAKMAADLGETEETLLGETLTLDKTDGVVINGEVTVVGADIKASNGVVHLIDKVLVPASLAPDTDNTIAAIATDTDALSTLVAALQRTPDLLEIAANANADITVFAPTNDAFANLLSALGADGLDDVPDYVLRRVLEHHILVTGKLAADLGDAEETLEGSTIYIDKTDGITIDGNASVILDLADIEAANGVVHVIDEVLIPPFIAQVLGTALQPLVFDAEGRFTTLVAALETQPELVDFFVSTEGDGTIFAPTNAAFEALIASNDFLESAADVLALDNLSDILLYHVAADRKAAADLKGASSATHSRSLNPNTGSPLEIYYSNEEDGSLILIGYSQVIEADIMTPNEEFIIHAIDGVLLPPTQSVVGEAANNPAFSELVAALTRVEQASGDMEALLPLVSVLSSERGEESQAPFTVFAPTNAAFEALYTTLGVDGVDEIAVETLQAVLLYHVISGEPVFSTDLDLLENGQAETLGGTITIDLDNLTIADNADGNQDASIVTTDVIATNGVIHAIDQVLLPE